MGTQKENGKKLDLCQELRDLLKLKENNELDHSKLDIRIVEVRQALDDIERIETGL